MTLGADHPQVAKRLSNLGSLLFEMKHFDEAKRLFSRANTICTKALGANHADTIACRGWCDVIDSHIKKKSQAVAHANVHESEEEKQARKGKQTAIEPVASTSAQDQAGPSSSRFMQRRMSMEAMLVQLGEIDERSSVAESEGTLGSIAEEAKPPLFTAPMQTMQPAGLPGPSDPLAQGTAAVADTPVGGGDDALPAPVAMEARGWDDGQNLAPAAAPDSAASDTRAPQPEHTTAAHAPAPLPNHPPSEAPSLAPPHGTAPNPPPPNGSAVPAFADPSIPTIPFQGAAGTITYAVPPHEIASASAASMAMPHPTGNVAATAGGPAAPLLHPPISTNASHPPHFQQPIGQGAHAPDVQRASLDASGSAVSMLQGSPTRAQDSQPPPISAPYSPTQGMDQAYLSMAQQLQQQQMAQQMQMQMMRMQEQILELKMTQVPQRGNVDGALDDVAEAELSLAAGAPPFQSLPPVGVNTDISAIDLDAFLAAKTEYLGQRRYRCLLDGKVLSTFNLMRVHVARSFPGEIREFAAEQRQRRMQGSLRALDPQPAAVSPDPTPAPAAAPPLAGHSDPGGAPAAPSSAPVPDERMEKLERELNRLQGAISAQLGATPAPAKVEQGPTAVASAPPGGARGGGEASSVQQTPAEARIAALENELRRMQASAPPALSATPVPFYTPNHGVPWSGGAAVGPAYSFYAERQAALDRVAALEGQYLHAVQQHPSLMAWATPAPMDRPGPGTAAAPSSIEPPAASSDAHGASAPPISAGGASLDAMLEAERGVSPFREGGAALIQNDAMRAPLGAGVGGVKDHMLALAKQGQHPPAATSSASAAKPHPLQSLMAQGQVDKVELFMCARSEQIGRRQFLCELDGHVLSTIDLLRAHFRKNYAREAEEWWAAQHFL